MSEKTMTQTLPKLSPEMLVPRMGEYLVQKGLITDENLQAALDHQLKETDKGNSILLGQRIGQGYSLPYTRLDKNREGK